MKKLNNHKDNNDKIKERGLMVDVCLKRVIRYVILYHYMSDVGESIYFFNIQWIINNKKINPYHNVLDDKTN
jgi:hypothetical protein